MFCYGLGFFFFPGKPAVVCHTIIIICVKNMTLATGHGFNMTSTRVLLGTAGLLRPKELDVIYRTVNETAGSKV